MDQPEAFFCVRYNHLIDHNPWLNLKISIEVIPFTVIIKKQFLNKPRDFYMLKKIISGGQTGADRAAIDLAIKLSIPHGGWIPKGRKTESGPLPLKYQLKEMDTADYPSRTRMNIVDSHGTVILSRGRLTGGSELTNVFAKVAGKPVCHIDLTLNDSFEAAIILQSFIMENRIEILNVAGPRASHDPEIYFDVRSILEAVFYMMFLDSTQEEKIKALIPAVPVQEASPKTKQAAVELIAADLSLKAKSFIARLADEKIQYLYFGWLDYLKFRLGLDSGNTALVTQMSQGMDSVTFTIEDGVMEIVKSLKQYVETHYSLKVIK
jgi:Circularly permutated YpsA SLOG family